MWQGLLLCLVQHDFHAKANQCSMEMHHDIGLLQLLKNVPVPVNSSFHTYLHGTDIIPFDNAHLDYRVQGISLANTLTYQYPVPQNHHHDRETIVSFLLLDNPSLLPFYSITTLYLYPEQCQSH